MKKITLLLIICCITAVSAFAQKDTVTKITGAAAKDLMSQLKIDTTKLLGEIVQESCKCIDSIDVASKGRDEITEAIRQCIDKQVSVYQMTMKLYHSMVDKGTDHNITINLNKESAEYKEYYYEIERMLNDSCAALRKKAGSDNKESANSVSSNPQAIRLYNQGLDFYNKEDYKNAIPLFEKAVAIDDKFAFAWDNIGICKRKTGDYEGAIAAYKKSLSLVPTGRTPLQNIAIVYEFQKDYDKALAAYQDLAKVYPDDPEAFYGAGRMYELKQDWEKAVDNMCKAYNAYIKANSPYRTDAETNLGLYLRKMKELGKEEKFYAILKENNITVK
ncbi:MAG: tetratricopeptide repeat protein [Bacteroidetes bacterium]|nr:tetratricopeptide repeat protein [Bacteroidota bacterium]